MTVDKPRRHCVPGASAAALASLFVFLVMPLAMAQAASAEHVLSGSVTADGQTAAAAIVTATETTSGIRYSAYSGPDGRYTLALPRAGRYAVGAQHVRSLTGPAETEVGEGATLLDLQLDSDPNHLSKVPSDQWLALLPDGAMKREFIVNCASCHEIDAARVMVDGQPRSAAQWREAFALMRAIDQYALLPQDFDDETYVSWLAEHFTAERINRLEQRQAAEPGRLRKLRVTEYPLPIASELPHDLVVGPDGRIWITAFFNDVIWALDATDGSYETYRVRNEDAEGWGQARALTFDAQGQLWVVLGGTHQLVRLDTTTRAFETFDIGMYAHSLVIDARGRIWFNDYFAKQERIGVFDPATRALRHIALPSAGLAPEQGLALPYGLQIDSSGRLYSTQLTGNTLVMFDTGSEEAELMTMPVDNAGPRRPAVDAQQRLWIPEWNTGHLSRFDPETQSFARFPVGTPGLGAYDAEVDPRTGEVWITGALASSMVLFEPATAKAFEIPLPTTPAYTRHLAVDPRNGDLWSAYSSLPAAEPRVVRIERLD